MTARFIVGDVRERMAEMTDGSFDLILCSPPFLALRSYLPDGHPDKAREIGSEATPAEFLTVLLELTAEWSRLLAPHGSLAVELGDTYSGSGGAGGDYNALGMRADQPLFRQSRSGRNIDEWPLDKGLCFIPQLYGACLAYGRNLLTGEASPAGMWRVRNLKPWIRSNPPVGALGDKERPATSYVVVATRARDRYFDLDAVRTPNVRGPRPNEVTGLRDRDRKDGQAHSTPHDPAGAPPLDWWHHVDAVLDACLDDMAGKPDTYQRTTNGPKVDGRDGVPRFDSRPAPGAVGARGVHLRRALERAGILRTLDVLDVSPKGYPGAHYAVWPPQLVKLLVDEMCPRRVCTTCGQPSRRIVEPSQWDHKTHPLEREGIQRGGLGTHGDRRARPVTLGWSDCGCPGEDRWRPGRILDPFVGSGTTLEVATGMGRDAVGIDIDERNADLARERVGMFLEVDQPTQEVAS